MEKNRKRRFSESWR